MSQLTPYFPLGGGLDLITPAIAKAPGVVIGAVNYEPVASGYSRVEGFERHSGRTAPSATGAILGGIVGAVAGHEISDKTGGSKGNQNIAAVAGAVGGAMAGNKIQQNVTGNSYDIQVRMDDGRVIVVNQKDLGGIRENTYVRVVNGRVVIR